MAETPATLPKTVKAAPRKRAAPAAKKATVPKLADTVTADAKTAFEKVKDQATTVVGEATDAARKVANTGKDKAAEALDGVSKLADDAARAIDDRLGSNYGDYARKASASVANVASALQSKDVEHLFADARTFVRKSPVVAIGAAAAVGFLLTRLVKIGSAGDSDKA